jgi:hypothetical protein
VFNNISDLSHYDMLIREHGRFHKSATKVLRWALTGQIDAARKSLGLHGDLTLASHRIKAAISVIQQELNQAQSS